MTMLEDSQLAVEIGKRIAAFRHASRLSQTALASRVGMRQAPLSNLEKGKGLPSTRVLLGLAQALNVSVDDLLGVQHVRSEVGGLLCICGDSAAKDIAEAAVTQNKGAAFPSLCFDLSPNAAETIASSLRRVLGCEHVIGLNLVQHLNWEGIAVIEAEISSRCAVFCSDSGVSCIVLSSTLEPELKSFTAAYGLGRIAIAARDKCMEERIDSFQAQKDRLANAVASAFLMPNELVSRYISSRDISDMVSFSQMAHSFAVTEEQLKARLGMLGIVTP